MFHTSYYHEDARTPNLALAASHIYAHLGLPAEGFSIYNYHIGLPSEDVSPIDSPITKIQDFRFNKNVEYQGIGNGTFMRVNACAALRLSLWCIEPEKSNFKRVCKHICFFVLKPAAIAFDTVMNTTLLVAKVTFLLFVTLGRGLQAISCSEDRLAQAFEYGWKNVGYHGSALGTMGASFIFGGIIYGLVGYVASVAISALVVTTAATSIAAGITYTIMTALGPKYDIFFRISNFYEWGYFVNDKKDFVLDSGKVEYLQKKCGWSHVSEIDLKVLSSPLLETSITKFHKDKDYLSLDAAWTSETGPRETTHYTQTSTFKDAPQLCGSYDEPEPPNDAL